MTPSPTIRWAVFIALAMIALVIRLPRLGERPMHTDESINGYITGNLLAGGSFHYDPQDRHGPVLYLLAAPLARAQGAKNLADLNETELRLSTVLVGSATILLFGAAVERFGFLACLVAALLFAVAPLPVYYSRYFIHETLFVATTFGLMLSGWQAWQKKSPGAAALAGLCAALLLANKETSVIHFFALGVAAAVALALKPRKTFPSLKLLSLAGGVFIVATILLFTWFGQNWSVFADMLYAVSRFATRAGGEGHQKPFSYYFHLLDPMVVLFIVAAGGVYAAIFDACTGARKSGLLLAIYGVVIFIIYSAIPYKTPWLALNLWLPLSLLCGLGIAAFWEQIKNPAGRWGVAIAGAFLLATLGAQTKLLAFDKPADEKNPLAYAHTGDDILRLAPRLEELAKQRNLASPRIAVMAADAWPLPWYLRQFSQVGYWQPGQDAGDADFFITDSDVPGKLAAKLKNYRPDFFGVRPNVLIILWVPAPT